MRVDEALMTDQMTELISMIIDSLVKDDVEIEEKEKKRERTSNGVALPMPLP